MTSFVGYLKKSPQELGFAKQYFLSENIGLCQVLVLMMKNKNMACQIRLCINSKSSQIRLLKN